ncbi:Ig-like domain-containing protein, partial [Providencia vermicola]|uniref:Ig-like domain-containing protein n=2 Tax=Providencia vermicola TaxID=333965 RepID=UPI0032DA323C
MKDTTITDKLENIEIQTFKVQGLDLIITKLDGSVETIKDGLSEIILGNMTLSTGQGTVLSQDEILSSIKLNIGADTVYIKEQLTSDIVEYSDPQDSKNKREYTEGDVQQDDEESFSKKLAELNQKNQQLEQTLKNLSSEKEVLLSSSLTKLTEAKKQLNQKEKAANAQVEGSDLAFSSPPAVAATPTSSSSPSLPANKTSIAPQIIKPKIPAFIQGKLSEEFDSGKNGDNVTNINTPIFTGVVSPDSQAYLTIDNKKYLIRADKDGKWTLEITEPLKDDVYEYVLTASSGGEKTVTVSGQLTVDTKLDILSVGLAMHSDIGVTVDKLTNKPVPTFSGKAEAGSTIKLTIADQTLSTVADEQGRWQTTVEKPLPDGLLTYQVTAEDVAGNHKMVTETVTIKTSKPDASAKLENIIGFLTNNTAPTLTGKTDPSANIIVKVAEKEYVTQANEQGNWSLTISDNLEDGSYVLNIKAIDIVGNQGVFVQNLLVDTAPPSAQAELVESSDSGNNITQQKAVTLAGSTKPLSTVVIQFAGKALSVTADNDGQWQATLPSVDKDGDYDYHVKVTDNVGNIGEFNGQFTVDTQVDHLSVQLDPLSDSGKVGDNITKDTRPHFVGKAEAGSRIELTLGEQQLNTIADSHGNWSVVVQKALVDGQYDYEVTATDVAGNIHTATESVQIKTILQSTTLQLNGQPNFITNQQTPTLSGQSEPHGKIQLSLGGESYSTVADDQGAWSIRVTSPLTPGNHPLKVLITDIAGNSEKISETVWLDTAPPSAQAELVENSDSGIRGDNITQQKAVTLGGSTKPQSTVEIQFAGKALSVIADNDGQWQAVLPSVDKDGDYDYHVKVTDNVGNIGAFNGKFTVDSTIMLTARLDPASQENSNALATNLKRPQISGTSDPESKITAEFKGQIKTVYADSQGKWSLIFDVDADVGKNNHYQITAEDAAGNQKILTQSFSYFPSSAGTGEASPPTLFVALDAACDSGKKGDYITHIKAPKFTGGATAGAKITLTMGHESFTTVADTVTGRWEIQAKEQPEGNCQYTVTAEHPANGKQTDISGSIFIDATAPVSTVELSAETDTGTKGNFITTHRRPVFTGKGEPGCEVTLQLNGESVSTMTDSNGIWSLTLLNELPKNFIGDYQITVTDAADNQFEKIDTLTVNANKPEISDAALISPWSTGKFYGEKSTNHLMATFQGKVTSGSSLKFKFRLNKKDEHIFSISDIDKDGHWRFSLPSGLLKSDRRYDLDNISLIATSPAGLMAERVIEKKGIQIKDNVLNVTFEVAAESSSTGDANNSLSSSRSPKLQGMISGSSDRDELKGIIFIGGKSYSVGFGKSRSSWNFKVPDDVQLPLGEVPYTLKFTDVYGSVRTFSSSVRITDFNFYLDPDTDSGQIGNHYTNHKNPAYKGKITPGGSISAKVNGKNYSIQANEKGEWRFEVPIKGDGAYHISFIQDDGTVSVGQTTLNVLTKASTFNDFHISETQVHSGTLVANVTNPKLIFTYNGNMDYYLISVNGKTVQHNKQQTKYDGSKTVFANELALPNGEHVAKITAFDIAGNKTEHEVMIKVLSDMDNKTSPSIEFGVNDKQLITKKDGTLLFNQNDLRLTGTTSAAGLITIKDVNGKTLGTVKANNQGVWQVKLPDNIVPIGIKDGESIPLSVTATDLANRETQFDFRLVYDVTPPNLTGSMDDVLSGSHVLNINQPTFSGITKANADVYLIISGNVYQTVADLEGKWQIKLSDSEALTDGIHTYEIKAKDVLGQVNQSEVSGNFIVKTVASVSGELEPNLDSGIQGDNCTNVNKPIFSGMTEPNAIIRLVFDNKTASTFETTANEKGEWTIQVDTELGDGLHEYVIYAIDHIQGIQGQVSGQLMIDTLAPDYLMGGVVDPTDSIIKKQDILTSKTKPIFAGIAEPGAYLEITVGQHIYTNILADKQGEWSFTLTEPLIDGTHDYHIRVTDSAGNLGAGNLTGKITVDTKAPELAAHLETISATSEQGDEITNINTPKFSGTTEPDSKVLLTINNQTYEQKANEQGEWSISVGSPLADG